MTAHIASRLRSALREAATAGGDPSVAAQLRLAGRLGIEGFVRRLAPDPADPPADRRLVQLADVVLRDATDEVSRALRARHVAHFAFKGAALVHGTYQPGDRAIGDVDLAIPAATRDAAFATLRDLGFQADPAPRFPLLPSCVWHRPGRVAGFDDADVDLHWAAEPVDRVFPVTATPFPAAVWTRVAVSHTPPVPAVEDHAALLVHQLVHHDLLHLRSYVDLALLWEHVSGAAAERYLVTADALGVRTVAVALGLALQRAFALPLPEALAREADRRAARLARGLALGPWLRWAAAAVPGDEARLGPRRLWRRATLIDRRWAALALAGEALWPPPPYLQWRWPEARSRLAAWARHVGRNARRVLGL